MTRRVIVLNHFACPRGAPGGTRHVELFGRLDGWTATVIAARRNLFTAEEVESGDEITGVWTTSYRGNGPRRVLNWLSFGVTGLVAGLRGPRPDVVYGSSPHLVAALAAWVLSRLRRSRFVLEVRDLWPRILVEMGRTSTDSRLYRWLERLERFLYRRADLIVVLAPGVKRTLVAEGVGEDRIVVISNGADPEDFEVAESRDELRRRYRFDGVVGVYAGAHGPANGLDQLLDAAAELRAEASPIRLVLVGDGADKPGLVDRVARERLDNVELRDPVPKSEMPSLLAAADIGIHVLADVPLFKYGVSPNKLFDYLAAGRCVISNSGGDVAALVDEAAAGVAVAPEGLAAGLRELAEAGVERRRQMGESGRSFMAGNRSRSALTAILAEELTSVLTDGHRGAAQQ